MIRMAILLASTLAVGCSNAPGKPKPIVNDGVPTPDMAFVSLFGSTCAGCHGVEGKLGPAPPLNDPLFASLISEADLVATIAGGHAGTSMPAFAKEKGGSLTADQVKLLARSIKANWGKTAAPAKVPSLSTAKGDAVKGKALFAIACAGCHGPEGKGGTWQNRPVGAIHEPAYLALTSDAVLRRYIITGRPDLGMPDFAGRDGRPSDFQPLSDADVADLTALLISWRTQK